MRAKKTAFISFFIRSIIEQLDTLTSAKISCVLISKARLGERGLGELKKQIKEQSRLVALLAIDLVNSKVVTQSSHVVIIGVCQDFDWKW